MDMLPFWSQQHGCTSGPGGGRIATASTLALLALGACAGSASATPPQKGPVPTQVAITPSETPSWYGSDTLTLATLVTNTSSNGSTPTGSLQFRVTNADDPDPLSLDASGAVVFVPPFYLDVGDEVSADYSGDATHSPSTGTLAPAILPDNTQTTASVSPNPAAVGQDVTIAADVTNLNMPDMTPFGSVIFNVDGQSLDPVPLDENGHAEVIATAAAAGQVVVGAHYFDDTGVPADMVDSYASAAGVVAGSVVVAGSPVAPVTLAPTSPSSPPAGAGPPGQDGGSILRIHPTARVMCVVPRLRGTSLPVARGKLRRAHCRLGPVTRSNRRERPRGRVLASVPRAGARRAAGTRVRLIVAGPRRPRPRGAPAYG